VLLRADFQRLLDTLESSGYRVVGPHLQDGSVVWSRIRRVGELPVGWTDEQSPGVHRVKQTGGSDLFGIVHGAQSAKPFTFAPRESLITIERTTSGLKVTPTPPVVERTALLGLRACDLAGLAVQDRIFLRDAYADPYYAVRRKGLFLIAVNCTRSVETCFCASMRTGPRATDLFDLALTELDDEFLIEVGSEAGAHIVAQLGLPESSEAIRSEATVRIDRCAKSQTRSLDQTGLPQVLYEAHDHPRWDHVAARCLACGNCTMVCPTCFCHGVEETPDLQWQRSEHVRLWDSCFTQEHGYIHGKNIRPTIKDRYRMWLTHKLGSWIDQFGTSGCVGCGRCITWCPVGIDLTVELPALMEPSSDRQGHG
jgi:ferredoxin